MYGPRIFLATFSVLAAVATAAQSAPVAQSPDIATVTMTPDAAVVSDYARPALLLPSPTPVVNKLRPPAKPKPKPTKKLVRKAKPKPRPAVKHRVVKPRPKPIVHKVHKARKPARHVVRRRSAPHGSPRAIARSVFGGQYACAERLIQRESGWNVYAVNRSSGAYGLGQALPGSKMASHGSDWRTNPYTQLRWVRSYVNSRYGGICGALAHSNRYGWY